MKTEFRRDLQHSYLVIHPDMDAGMSYPLKMITENQILGLLSCSPRNLNEETLYYYDVTSMIPLEEWCLCRKMTGTELLRLIHALLQTLLCMEEYLLDGSALCLDSRYIYVDAQMEQIRFCYIPGENWDLETGFRTLMENLLPLLDHQNQKEVMAGYHFYQYAVQEPFSAEGLRGQLEKCQRELSESSQDRSLGEEKTAFPPGPAESGWPEPAEEGESGWSEPTKEEESGQLESAEESRRRAALDSFFANEEEDDEGQSAHPAMVTLGTVFIILYGLSGWYLWRNFPFYLFLWGGCGILAVLGGLLLHRFYRRKELSETAEDEEDLRIRWKGQRKEDQRKEGQKREGQREEDLRIRWKGQKKEDQKRKGQGKENQRKEDQRKEDQEREDWREWIPGDYRKYAFEEKDEVRAEGTDGEKVQKRKAQVGKIRDKKVRAEQAWNEKVRVEKVRNEKVRNEKVQEGKVRDEQVRDEQVWNEKVRVEKVREGKAREEKVREEQVRKKQVPEDEVREKQVREDEDEEKTQILHPEQHQDVYLLEPVYPNAGESIRLGSSGIHFIGQLGKMADIVLPSRAVSRLHARMRLEEGHCFLCDLNSRNGTWVNQEVLPGEQEVELHSGDEVRFAELIYILRRI